MQDITEKARRELQHEVNAVEGSREALEAKHGQVWDTRELQTDFEIGGFMAPYIVVRRKSDGSQGSMTFQHSPRFYFSFSESHSKRTSP